MPVLTLLLHTKPRYLLIPKALLQHPLKCLYLPHAKPRSNPSPRDLLLQPLNLLYLPPFLLPSKDLSWSQLKNRRRSYFTEIPF